MIVKKIPARAGIRLIGRGGHEIDFRFAFVRVDSIVELIEKGISFRAMRKISEAARAETSARCAQIEAYVPASELTR